MERKKKREKKKKRRRRKNIYIIPPGRKNGSPWGCSQIPMTHSFQTANASLRYIPVI
jgi:hypothetical protein